MNFKIITMTESKTFKRRCRRWLRRGGLLVVCAMLLTACDGYDLDERTPEGWGSSIYDYMASQGNFSNMVRMIDELNYREVLDKTGSKTLFAADDDAFSRFFEKNDWGVRRYEELTLAQKKMLVFGAMINNSYQVQTLSSVEGPIEGACMRRLSAMTELDTVPVLRTADMPDNPYWQRHRAKGQIVCMKDNTIAPMTHFIERFMQNNKITNEDYDFIYNNTTKRKTGDASVNGVQIEESNIRCSNGFVHRMAEVVAPLPNMAEVIASKPNTTIFNRLLERYCAPYPCGQDLTNLYNVTFGTNVDTVYQKRFFSEKSQNGLPVDTLPDGGATPDFSQLKFDPEWNTYFSSGVMAQDVALQRDMAVIMVPSDAAMREYWNNGAGRVLKDYYGTWDNVPNRVVTEFVNNNMLSSFVGSVPSKFSSILNDANDPMGVTTDAIDSVWQACNGAVYLTNKVYSPTSYVSVMSPVLINETMKILYWAIGQLQFDVYLNSLNAYYSFFVPTNKALLEYIDPVSYGKTTTQLYRFYYDSSPQDESDRVKASIWNYDPETGEVTDSIGMATKSQITNRLKDILETHIVIGDVEDGHEYYRTKGGTEIRVRNVNMGANGMTVEGSYQVNEGEPLRVSYVYDQSKDGNGKVYILEGQPILGTRHTVRDILAAHPEFSKFLDLMDGSGLFEFIHETGTRKNACGGNNISLFSSYHYTVYVPTNESIEALQNSGKLPTWESVDLLEEMGQSERKTADSLKIVNFLKYHIQDNAVFVNATPQSANYETSTIDPTTERFYKLDVEQTAQSISITDGVGNVRHVVTTNPQLYNQMAREYQYNLSDASRAGEIYTSSSAVVHLIDGALAHP